MHEEGVECSRCGATFESQDELIVHSIDTHSGVEPPADDGSVDSTGSDGADGSVGDLPTAESLAVSADDSATEPRVDGGTAATRDLDPEAVERLTTVLEERSTGDLTVNYRQRFLAVASLVILAVALALSYLHLTDVLDTAVYMFALGTLFGLTLSYLQAFTGTLVG